VNVEELLALELPVPLPRDKRRPIGIIGAGRIVNNAHLPAYRKAGFDVVAIYDPQTGAAERSAATFGIPVVARSADELLARGDIEIVDIAVTPEAQRDIAFAAIAAGKHLLCQKPLSESYATAVSLVEAAERAGVQLAVNHQMRWNPCIAWAHRLLELGWYGRPTEGRFDVDLFSNWGWMGERPRVEYFYNSIHYHDIARYLFGEPTAVIASSARYPGQQAHAETRSFTILEYDDMLRVLVVSNHNNWSGELRADVHIHGTEGRSEASMGFKAYPDRASDTFAFTARTNFPAWTHSRRFAEAWLPDTFIGPMASLMHALESDEPPLTSGRDNLNSLKIVHAAYLSIAEGRRVELAGFTPVDIA
jgi:predicted dehydrogenase